MAVSLSHVMSQATYARLEMLWRNGTLTPRWSRLLLEIWSEDKPIAMKNADEANSLLPLLTSYAPMLNKAPDLEAQNPHLAEHEILELAGVPLKFPR